MNRGEMEPLLALAMLPRMTPLRLRRLIRRAGSPAAAWDRLEQFAGSVARDVSGCWLRERERPSWSVSLDSLEQKGIRLLARSSPDYPR
ncbi:MAG: hypothetical protein ACYC55_04695, partial [Candidatus Geothermincolia bacterium]